jgi:fatty-acyl-CoA synthase
MNLALSILDTLQSAPAGRRFTFRHGGGEESVDGRGLAARIAGFARGFADAGFGPRSVMPIMAPSSARLWAAFVGAVAADLIPCILPGPTFKSHLPTFSRNLARLLERYGTGIVLVDGERAATLGGGPEAAPGIETRHLSLYDRPAPELHRVPRSGGDDVAFLQHSSGSTGVPKGVALSHRAVLGHVAEYAAAIGLDSSRDAVASWLPLYHDMGLLTSFLMPLLCGVSCHTLRPEEWILDPASILSLVSETRASLAWWPNFAYSLLARRARAMSPHGFDLSSLRLLVNCSEPVSPVSHDAFRAAFEGFGLGPHVLQTCYAMAENVFAVSGSGADGPRRLTVRRDQLAAGCDVEPCSEDSAHACRVMSSGRALPSVGLRIMDPGRGEAPRGRVGEIAIAGPWLAARYYRHPEPAADPDGWRRTNDLGFLWEDDLFVLGRLSDLIVVGGRKLYPDHVEDAASRVQGVKEGRVVAFGVPVEERGTEELVVIAESTLHEDLADVQRMKREIRARVMGQVDCRVDRVLIVRPSSLIKTSSGKIARRDNRDWFLSRSGA